MYTSSREGVKKMESDSFTVVLSERARGIGHKLKQKKYHLNIRKNVFTMSAVKRWNRLPREFVSPPAVEIFKTRLYVILGNLLKLTLL